MLLTPLKNRLLEASRNGGSPRGFFSLALLMACLMIVCPGCGSRKQMSPSSIATSQQSFEAGEEALESGNFQQANDLFSKALEQGGLTPDQVSDTLLYRARARMELGLLEEARADLYDAELGAMNMGRVYALMGELSLKQGDLNKARGEYEQARKHDPSIEIPEKLRKQ